jgi:muconolactone delta-isomerase
VNGRFATIGRRGSTRVPDEGAAAMKFLVLWKFELAGLRPDVVPAIARMPQYAERLFKDRKLVARYHIVGRHGGAWIYDVASNEELERLLAMAPVYNFAHYEVLPLAEMEDPLYVLKPPGGTD